MLKPALEAFPLSSTCAQYRALNSADTLCYGTRNFADLLACHNRRLYSQKDAKFCQKCGGSLSPAADPTDELTLQTEDGDFGTAALGAQYGHKPSQHARFANQAEALGAISHPAFDFTVEQLFCFRITFFDVGRWKKLVQSEGQSKDCVLAVIHQMHQVNTKRGEFIKQFYFPLQMLLMARGRGEFSAIQQEPVFNETGRKNLTRLYDAYTLGGDAVFDEEWKQTQSLSVETSQDPQEIVTYFGGPGLTKENAVMIREASPETTVDGEDWYLAYLFGRMGVEWKPKLQALIKREETGKMYDLLDIEFTDGCHRQCYFDVSYLPY